VGLEERAGDLAAARESYAAALPLAPQRLAYELSIPSSQFF
jgi:hypothetical protein